MYVFNDLCLCHLISISLSTLNYSSTSTVIEITQYLLSDDKTSVSAILVFLYAHSVRVHIFVCMCGCMLCVCLYICILCVVCMCVCAFILKFVCVCSITCELIDSFSLMVTVLLGYFIIYIVCFRSPCWSFPLNNFCCIHPI